MKGAIWRFGYNRNFRGFSEKMKNEKTRKMARVDPEKKMEKRLHQLL
jgi:hypothetical protein